MRALCLLVCLAAFPTESAAQDADALMEAFAEAWSSDDTDAVRAMMADDVIIVHEDDLLDGPEAVVRAWGPSMAATGRMTITPTRSGTAGDAAYQVGRWTLEGEGGTSSGSHHFTFRTGPGAPRLVAAHIRTDAPPPPVRAAAGEPVVLMVTPVAADKRAQFEAFMHEFRTDLAANVEEGRDRPGDRAALESMRFLAPAQPNGDGSYTYVFLADPHVPEADYSILEVLRLRYDEAEAERRYARFTESLAGPQQFIVLTQPE